MKTLKKIRAIAFLLIVASLFINCSNDDGDDNGGGSGDGTLTAKVDGQDFKANSMAVGATISNGVLAVQGSDSDGKVIRMNILNYTGTGTYKTGDNIANVNSIMYATVNPAAGWTSTFNIGSGTITVTSDSDGTVEGTFSFTGFNAEANTSKNVTEGKFKAKLQ